MRLFFWFEYDVDGSQSLCCTLFAFKKTPIVGQNFRSVFLTSFLSDFRDKGVSFSQLYRRLLLVLGSYISGHCTSCVHARTAKLVLTTPKSKEAVASSSELFFQNVVDYYV